MKRGIVASLLLLLPTETPMPSDLLAQLLAPYRSAVAGEETDLSLDPIYGTLAQFAREAPATTNEEERAVQNFTGDIPSMIKRMARRRYGWTGEQLDDLMALVNQESGFNPQADNPTSTAYGLFQFLESTRENYGLPLSAGPKAQTRAGLRYIKDRYSNPSAAWDFHLGHNYY